MNRMPRRRFVGTAAGVGAAAMGMSGTASAVGGDEPWENKLYPTGVAQTDYNNLKNAIARGGVIRLMNYNRRTGAKYFNLVNREIPFPAIVITRDVSIVGQNTKIVCNSEVFHCESSVRMSMKNLHFSMLDANTPSPFSFAKPKDGQDINVAIQVSLGNDDPWD